MSRITLLVVAIAMSITACVALMAPQLVTGSQWLLASSFLAPRIELPRTDSTVVPMSPDPSDGVVDLYGNDVSPAVAEYSIDPLGSPYEVHSPQTELPRLASPKS